MPLTQYYTATTLDGFIADEQNSLDWLFAIDGEPGNTDYAAFFDQVGAMAMGATTYEWVVEHEGLVEEPEKWRRWYGETPCWVFTHRRLPVLDGAAVTFVQGDVRSVHDAMTAAAGEKNIWLVGGGELVGQFVDQGLLDELLLTVAPVTLGRGAPLLPRRLSSEQLELTDVSRVGQFARLAYRVGSTGRS